MTKINQIYKTKPVPVLSFEVYPPHREESVTSLFQTLEELNPRQAGVDFISVTYGAGGSANHERTQQIASYIQNHFGVTALHHLTGINQTPATLHQNLSEMKAAGIENILAVRGDLPSSDYDNSCYPFAKDLITDIKKENDFSIGAAVYPEGHVDNPITGISVGGVREKISAGSQFLISQLFFDNNAFYKMQEELKNNYIQIPVSAGILPIISQKQVEKLTYMIGSSLPAKLAKIVHKYQDNPEALRQAGMAYAMEQIYDLLDHGVDGIHLYAMNQADILTTMLPKINDYIQCKNKRYAV